MLTPTNRRRTTLGRRLTRTVTGNLAAATVAIGTWAVVSGGAVTATSGEPYPDAGLDRVERLVETHDCWTGEQPADVDQPQHAVVTLPGGRARVMSADVGYGIWLYQEPGVLHAFCA